MEKMSFRPHSCVKHGFPPGASTCTNLIDTLYDVCRAVNQGKSVDITQLDLVDASDRVCHQKLHKKDYTLMVFVGICTGTRLSDLKLVSQEIYCASGVPQ
ncbi:hypothetical protein COOONC_26516, partial [Cooperia oncophora]